MDIDDGPAAREEKESEEAALPFPSKEPEIELASKRSMKERQPSNLEDIEETGERPGPTAHGNRKQTSTRLLTKTQLSDMAWGVRELSQRLGSIKLKLKVNTVFILTKTGDVSLIAKTREVAEWLLSPERDVPYTVFVEDRLQKCKKFDAEGFCKDKNDDQCSRLKYWNRQMCVDHPEIFDFVITLGGDGTVLYASWLFQKVVPPVLSFACGSLGFLTQFDFEHFRETLTDAFRNGVRVSLRLRFEGTVMRAVEKQKEIIRKDDGTEMAVNNADASAALHLNCEHAQDESDSEDDERDLVEELLTDEPDDSPTHKPTTTFSILNDIIIDRGPSANLTTLELFTSSASPSQSSPDSSTPTTHLTSLMGDGLCIATPTGSTAYNLAASGPLCHPSNPVMLLTAICAHTLSFRPLILPDSIVLRVGVPYDARQGAWAAFDGRERVRLGRGDYVSVRAGRWPFATVGRAEAGEWESGLKCGLGWNTRGGPGGHDGRPKKLDRENL
ncbi:MAG: NAD(+)/NADH kinase [Leuconostoc sp.]|nr:NAD(+)/NADH kinase [Leuconostoc sp.]